MTAVEIDEYVGIPRSDRRRSAVREIDAAVGQSQIVDDRAQLVPWNHLTDVRFDRVAQRSGFFLMRVPVRARGAI